MLAKSNQIIHVALGIKITAKLAKISHTLKHGNTSNGYYGKYRVAARGFNNICGDAWRKKGSKLDSDRFWGNIFKDILRKSLVGHSNIDVPWKRVREYGEEEASLLADLRAKKEGAQIKALNKGVSKKR